MIDKERKLIGKGRVSSIYSDGLNAFKTYPSDYSLDWIMYEYKIHNEVYKKTNLPLLKYELIESDKEIKMDIINGLSLADRMRKQKYLYGLDDLISLQKDIFKYSDLNIPDAFATFEKRIKESNLEDAIKDKALQSLYSIEKMNILCHFDLHFENIMYDGNKYFIIDWVNALLSNPILDIARVYIILKQYAKRLAYKYLNNVTKQLNINKIDVIKSLPIIASLRLLENDDISFNKTLIELIYNPI